MSDDLEGPDPNQVRRHAKKMLSALDYAKRYRRIDFYRPNAKQLEFHNSMSTETALRAGTQMGKTHAGAAQMAMDALSLYPDWYKGRRFVIPPPIERDVDFIGWAASLTSIATRDGAQLKLLGDISQDGGLGQGLIPLDNIVKVSRSRGIDSFVDTVTLRRETGGSALIRLKTFEQGAESFQGTPCDEIWLDEDVGFTGMDIWKNCLARFNATNGKLIWTATPRIGLGRTPWRQRFSEGYDPNRTEVLMTLRDVEHIAEPEKEALIKRWSTDRNADTILYGADAAGGGNIFDFPIDQITHSRDPNTYPHYWKWIIGLDFSHFGTSDQSHPFAAVSACYDSANDKIYIHNVLRMKGAHSAQHIANIRRWEMFDAPVCWPHDGQQAFGDAGPIADVYRRGGLNMQPTWTTFPLPAGGYSLEAGISPMRERFARGGLLFPKWETDLLDEYSSYHYDQNSKPVSVGDDILSAVRQVVMGIRHAKEMSANPNGGYSRRSYAGLNTAAEISRRNDFNLFTGD
jgi:phage terminase large subunit-like protein